MEDKLSNHKGGSIVMGLLSTICFQACFLAEVVFNKAVLPWLLSVPELTLLGIALAVAPATAPVILDRLLRHMFDVEDPWTHLKSAVFSPFGLRVRRAVSILFIAVVVLGNLFGIWLLADCREVASKLMNQETAIGLNVADEDKIRRAIQSLSIVLCVDGALFFLFAAHEFGGWGHQRNLQCKASRLLSEQREVESEHAQAKSDLAVRQEAWDRVDVDAQIFADEWEARKLLDLEQIATRPAPVKHARQWVAEILDAQLSGRSSLLTRAVVAQALDCGQPRRRCESG